MEVKSINIRKAKKIINYGLAGYMSLIIPIILVSEKNMDLAVVLFNVWLGILFLFFFPIYFYLVLRYRI